MLGFSLLSSSSAKYRCNLVEGETGIEITTLVFERPGFNVGAG